MTKEVLIRIAGLHEDLSEEMEEEQEAIELVSPGTYYEKEGIRYLFYEEREEDMGVVKCQIRIYGQERIEVIKKGSKGMHMIYEKGKKNQGSYGTPYGTFHLGVHTKKLQVEETEDELQIAIAYTMDVNFEPIADCKISIRVQSRGKTKGDC